MENVIKCLRKSEHFIVMKTFETQAFGDQRKEAAFFWPRNKLFNVAYRSFSSKQIPKLILTCLCLVRELI